MSSIALIEIKDTTYIITSIGTDISSVKRYASFSLRVRYSINVHPDNLYFKYIMMCDSDKLIKSLLLDYIDFNKSSRLHNNTDIKIALWYINYWIRSTGNDCNFRLFSNDYIFYIG